MSWGYTVKYVLDVFENQIFPRTRAVTKTKLLGVDTIEAEKLLSISGIRFGCVLYGDVMRCEGIDTTKGGIGRVEVTVMGNDVVVDIERGYTLQVAHTPEKYEQFQKQLKSKLGLPANFEIYPMLPYRDFEVQIKAEDVSDLRRVLRNVGEALKRLRRAKPVVETRIKRIFFPGIFR